MKKINKEVEKIFKHLIDLEQSEKSKEILNEIRLSFIRQAKIMKMYEGNLAVVAALLASESAIS